ncbi:helix-turn-helix transcriptional regulator [Sphingomonas bacterium]|uniref:helix-turn-helix transcriptional regulator n=1 Tax=Sphingomonas bacterium TaxID=1895847 RepID=UPI0015777661|nr:LuxR C-terminal-related transcriptional regulator [Sphingomonas bacterium]
MDMHELRTPHATSTLFNSNVAPLIEQVGVEAFSPALFRLAHETLGCMHMSAFAVGRTDSRTLVLAENIGSSRIAHRLGQRYIERYWGMDPMNATGAADGPALRIYEMNAREIDDSDYRYQCYTSVDLATRLSVCETRADGAIRINFYREQAFSDREKDVIVGSLGLLIPLLRRHALSDEAPETAVDFERRLRKVAPELTAREREVCALIALGVTSEGIGLELGISLNTVLTYRKRAYARLRIVSQNQLLRLVCRSDRDELPGRWLPGGLPH